jgi:hypothetical protein
VQSCVDTTGRRGSGLQSGTTFGEVDRVVYMAETLALANEVFAPTSSFAPSELLASFQDAATVGEAADLLHLLDVLDSEQQEPMATFLATIPPAIDAAIMAAARNALSRGLRVTFTWQPGYDFELRAWDVSKFANNEWRGMVNLHVTSPHPPEAEPLP